MRFTMIVGMLFLATQVASAHGLLLDARSDGQTITGTAYYSNGARAANEAISLLDLTSADSAVRSGQTDTEGKFTFPVTAGRAYRIAVHGEEGHSVELELIAQVSARPLLIDDDAVAEEQSWLPPAWAIIGGALLLSLVPTALLRKPRDLAA